MKKLRVKEKGTSTGQQIGIGVLIAVVATVIFASVIALLIIQEVLPESAVTVLCFVGLLVSSFAGCIFTGKRSVSKVAIYSGITAGIYIALMLAIGIVIFDGELEGVLPNTVSILVGYGVACALCISRAKSGHKRKWRNW